MLGNGGGDKQEPFLSSCQEFLTGNKSGTIFLIRNKSGIITGNIKWSGIDMNDLSIAFLSIFIDNIV